MTCLSSFDSDKEVSHRWSDPAVGVSIHVTSDPGVAKWLLGCSEEDYWC